MTTAVERPVCGACNGYGQVRQSSAGPYTVCAACGGAGRVTGEVGAVHALTDVGPAGRPAVVAPLEGHGQGAHAGHVAEYDGAVWHCVTCPARPVVPAPVGGVGPVTRPGPGVHAGHTAEYDGRVWRCATCDTHPVVPAP